MSKKQIVVGISDLNIASSPDELISYALGSCVGICLYDKFAKIAGLSHILLPDSKGHIETDPKKFANTAVKMLLDLMMAKGCRKGNIVAKIAGGANMFAWAGETIGDKNVKAVQDNLALLQIPIVAKDVGSNYGRTVLIETESGIMTVRSLSKETKSF